MLCIIIIIIIFFILFPFIRLFSGATKVEVYLLIHS